MAADDEPCRRIGKLSRGFGALQLLVYAGLGAALLGATICKVGATLLASGSWAAMVVFIVAILG